MESGRQEKVDAGREKFAAYQKRKKKSLRQRDGGVEDEASVKTLQPDTSTGSLEESLCSSPSSVVSVVVSDNIVVQELNAKVKELEDIIEGQQVDYKTQLEGYVNRLREYEGAVEERNSVIERLTASLQTELTARQVLQQQGDHLAQEVSLLERQLQATSELVQGHRWHTGVRPDHFLALQNKVLQLEALLAQKEDVKTQLAAKESELETMAQELREHKNRSAEEVQRLMREVEQVQQRAAAAELEHHSKLAQLEESFGLQLRMKEEHRRLAEEEKQLLKMEHEKELSALRQQYVSAAEHDAGKVSSFQNGSGVSAEDGELRQQVVRLTLELASSSRKLEETLQLNDSLREALGQEKSRFESELAAVERKKDEEAQNLRRDTDGLRKQLEEALLSNQRLSAELGQERAGREQDVAALSSELRETHNRLQNFMVQLEELRQAKQFQEESYKQVIDSLNERLKESAEAEERIPHVLSAHVESFKADSLVYKEQVDSLNVRLQESMKNCQIQEKLMGEKDAELIVLKDELRKVRTLQELTAESESCLRQQVDSLSARLEESLKHKKDVESYKSKNDALNSKIEDMNNILSSREQRIQEYEVQVATLNSKLEELVEIKTQVEVYKEKIKTLGSEANSLIVFKDKAAELQSEIDIVKENLTDVVKMFADVDTAATSEQHSVSKREVAEEEIPVVQLRRIKEKCSYILERRDEEVRLYKMQIADLNTKLAESAQAAEKQACEWEEQITFYRDRLESLGSQVCLVEEEQRTEVSRLQDAYNALQASRDEETAALKIELASQKVHHDEVLEQQKCAFDAEMAQVKEAHNVKLVELDETYKSQLSVQTKQLQCLEMKVKEFSQEVDKKSAELESLQGKAKLLEEYEVKISGLECELAGRESMAWNVDMNELELCRQQIDVLKSRLEEATATERKHMETVAVYQRQVDGYQQQVELLDRRCTDELEAHQREIDELQERLVGSCITENELRGQLTAREEEAATLRGRVEALTAALGEKDVHGKSLQEKLSAVGQQLLELNLSRENSIRETEVLRKEITFLQEMKPVEETHDQICAKCELRESLEVELAKLKNENEELKNSLNKAEKREEQLNADLAKHQSDVMVLNCKIAELKQEIVGSVELKSRVEELTAEKSKAGQQALVSGMQQQGVSPDVQELTVQCLKTDSLAAAKDELQIAFRERIVELEQALDKVSQENSQLTLKVVKAKELLKRLKEEKNKISAKNADLMTECERLKVDWEAARKELERERDELRAQIELLVEEVARTKSLNDQLLADGCAAERQVQERDREVCDVQAKLQKAVLELNQLKLQLREKEESLDSMRMDVKAGEALHKVLQQQLVDKLGGDNMVETLILEHSGQMKEVVVLRERLQRSESRCKAESVVKDKYESELNEMWKVRKDLEDRLAETREELGAVRFENERLRSREAVWGPGEMSEEPTQEFGKDSQQEKLLEPADEWEEGSVLSWDYVLSDYESELLQQLALHRERHVGLAELLGSSGILQETMYQQKQLLLKKLQEKVGVDRRLEEQRVLYRDAQSKLQALEQQMLEKDNVQKELARQKRLLQQDLREIEERLCNQEAALRTQRLALEAEVRARDQRARHWELQACAIQASSSAVSDAKDEHLREVRAQLDSVHARAIESLRKHFQEQLVVRESVLSSQIRSVLGIPRDQMLSLVALISSEMKQYFSQAGDGNRDDSALKLAETLAAAIVQKLENELEVAVGGQVSAFTPLRSDHAQEFDLKDTDSYDTTLQAVEETLRWEYSCLMKEVLHAWRECYMRELARIVSIAKLVWTQAKTTHYEQLETVASSHDEVERLLAKQQKLLSALQAFEAEFLTFHRGSMTTLLQAVQSEHDQFLKTMEQKRTKVFSVQSHIEQATLLPQPSSDVDKLRLELEAKHTREMEELRQYFEQKCADMEKRYSEEVFSQQSRKWSGTSVCSAEELATDMFAAGDHGQRVSALTHICDSYSVEPNYKYSEEVLSQHSSKWSGSNVGSAEELATDIFAAGDHGQRVSTLTHICDSYSAEPNYKDLEEHYRADYDRRILEYRDQLEAVKVSLEQKYRSEMAALREHYEQLILLHQHEDKTAEHRLSDDTLTNQLERRLDDVKYVTENIIDELAQISSEAAIDKVRAEAKIQEEVCRELEEQRKSRMVDACTETQPVADSVVTAMAPEGAECEKEVPEAQLSVDSGGGDNFASLLDELRTLTSGTAASGCIEKLAALHGEELKTLQAAIQDQAGMFALEHEAWERRLHERVEQAKSDVVATLHHHLQALISETEKSAGPVPQELAALREKFVGPLQCEVERLKQELAALKTQEQQKLTEHHGSVASIEVLTTERDELRRMVSVLRSTVRELLDYFARCEDELNVTLVEELSPTDRVHLTPDMSTLAGLVSDDPEGSTDTMDVSLQFRGELNRCLARLHAEASSVLALSRSIAGCRELVGEGLYELVQPPRKLQPRDPTRRSLSEPSSLPTKLLDEMHQERDRILEEARREKEDLQLQVEAADKQLRSTRQFLEEQAVEREQEREEFTREVVHLQAQLRERERDCIEYQHLLKEVECLDQQLKESTVHLGESEAAKARLQADLDTAAEKISTLREIIVELEVSVEKRAVNEENLKHQLVALESLLHQQDESHRQLASELESLREESGRVRLAEHISALEEQLCRHRLHVEQFQSDSGAVRRMKTQIQELEVAVGRKARELESLHCIVPSGGSPVSSPLSEDISIREQLEAMRCSTPERTQRETPSPVPLPLEELQRLQDKLQWLSRAEESALKRITDLEMELRAARRREEEVSTERDVLQKQTEEQLLKISSLQARLDEQRRAVDSAQRLALSELRSELLERDDEIHSLRDACDASHKEVKELRNLLEQVRQQAAAQEAEMVSLVEKLQDSAREREDHRQAASAKESVVSMMEAMLSDSREEQHCLQDELAAVRTQYGQLQRQLLCYQNIPLLPHQRSALEASMLLQSGDLESDAHPSKRSVHLDHQPELVHEEVLMEAPDFSLSYSSVNMQQEKSYRSVPEVQDVIIEKEQQLKELQGKYSLLQNVEHENGECTQQVLELQEVCATVTKLQIENSSLVQEVETLKAKYSEAQLEKFSLEQRVEELTAQCSCVETLQQEKYLLNEEIEALQHTCSSLENLQRENKALAKEMEAVTLERGALETLRGENALLLKEVEHLRSKLSSLEDIREENSKLLSEVSFFKTECLRLSNLEQEKISLLEKINDLNSKCLSVEQLEKENFLQAQKIVELQILCSDTNKLQEENLGLSQKVANLQKEIKKIQEENVHLSRDIKDLDERCAVAKQLQQENLSLSQKIKELDAQCSNLRSSLQEENKSLSEKVQELQDRCSLVENLQEEKVSLSKKLEQHQIDSSLLKKMQQENVSLYQRIEDLQAKCGSSENLRQENAALVRKLTDLEAQCVVMSGLQKENAALSQQVHELNIRCKFLERLNLEDDGQSLLSCQDQDQNILKLQEEKKVLQEAYLKVLQDMENKQESLDELSGQLQRELEESEKLDLSLLERLTSSDEDIPNGEILQPSLGVILKKILASGISVLTFPELSLLHQHVCSATAAVVVQDSGGQYHTTPLCASLDTDARNTVSQLEGQLVRERQLASDLRASLGGERLRAEELANHVRLQSQLLADMQVQQTNAQSSIARYTELLEMERSKTLCLEEKVATERTSARQLQAALEAERQKMRSMMIQDCSLLEALRQQLDVALEKEEKLHHQVLLGTNGANTALQRQVTELQTRVSQLQEELLQERAATHSQRQVSEEQAAAVLQGQLDAIEAHLLSLVHGNAAPVDDDSDAELRQRIVGLKEKLQELSAARGPDALEERLAPLRRREQQLIEDLGAAQRQVAELRTAVVVREQRLAAAQDQLAALGRELSASRSRQAELERRLTPEGLETSLPGKCVPASAVDGSDNRETERLQGQIKLLQEQQKVNRAIWLDQKAVLEEALEAARSHARVDNRERPQSADDLEDRLAHLFGKYLRSESYRKSLVWQKRYLLVALAGYQDCQVATLGQLALVAGRMPSRTQSSPRIRFRVAVVAVVAIQRMHYLVRRWKHGRRIRKSAIVNHPFCDCVGPGNHPSNHAPWNKCGQDRQSPQDRDREGPWHSSGQHRPWRLGENGCVTLLEPSSLAQYAARSESIQRRLGLATST